MNEFSIWICEDLSKSIDDFQTFFSEFYYVIIYYVSFITSFMWVLFFFDKRIANPILLSEGSFEISEVVYRVRS